MNDNTQYESLCAECGRALAQNVHIYIMTNVENDLEQVVCSDCRQEIDWEPQWRDDQDDDSERQNAA
jgi:hypothetical protein